MAQEKIYIYCDASYSNPHGIAVIGFAIFDGISDHESLPLDKANLQLSVIQESNNIRAEIRGAIEALKSCSRDRHIMLFTDCQTIYRLPPRRQKLEEKQFMSHRKQGQLSNADLYQAFFSISDRFNLEIAWVKGHISVKNLSRVQMNFSLLDKSVRRRLRKAVTETRK